MTEQELHDLIAADEQHLGVGDEKPQRRHQEIMELVEAAQENGSRRRGAPQGSGAKLNIICLCPYYKVSERDCQL